MSLNADFFVDCKLFTLLVVAILLEHVIYFCIKWHVWTVEELLLMNFLPAFEVTNFDMIHRDSGRVASLVSRGLLRFFDKASNAGQDGIDKLNIKAGG